MVPRLSELLGTTVEKVDDCIGPKVEAAVGKLQNGQVTRVKILKGLEQQILAVSDCVTIETTAWATM